MTDAATATQVRKYSDPDITANGQRRARVRLEQLRTLWINTGTLCNIACTNCYIDSSPTNDAFAYITRHEAASYLDEIADEGWPVKEIGFTGGEPFMNPDMAGMLEDVLSRGLSALVLTNAMQPMMRPPVQEALLALHHAYGEHLRLRVSLDHYTEALHDKERGAGAFQKTLEGIDWLSVNGLCFDLAGRTCWGEAEKEARKGYASLAMKRGWPIDADDPASLVLFPEMNDHTEVPEITEACWDILDVSPTDLMCASSRMIVKRRGDTLPSVLPCTLLTDTDEFDMGHTLNDSLTANGPLFDHGVVKLFHRHCARFCVLGGGSCSSGAAE